MDPVLSVIVPVYNVEKYLDRCVKSLLNQSFQDIEIILVDDGSTDSSGQMCDIWKTRDCRIKVVHKKNQGLGFARNSGIEIATGKYIAYVDSDDYILPDLFIKVIQRLEKTSADICYFGCIDIWTDHKLYGHPPKKLFYSSNETIEYVKAILGPIPQSTEFLFGGVSAWSGIVKRELLEKNCIKFHSEREFLCEDIIYNLQVCMSCESIAIEPTCLYCYCHNDTNSLTTKYRADRFEAALKLYFYIREMLGNYVENEEINERIIRSLMQNLIVCVKQEILYEKTHGKKYMNKMLNKICSNPTVQKSLGRYPIKKMPIRQRILFYTMKYKNCLILRQIVKIRVNN